MHAKANIYFWALMLQYNDENQSEFNVDLENKESQLEATGVQHYKFVTNPSKTVG
jgi:hypothetical protein